MSKKGLETGKRWLLTQIKNWRLHSDIHELDRVEGAKMSAGNRTRFMGRVFGSLLAWLLVSSSPAFACGEPGTADDLFAVFGCSCGGRGFGQRSRRRCAEFWDDRADAGAT